MVRGWLDSDLASFTVDNECVDVNTVVARYDEFLSSLLNKHALLKEIDDVERPLHDWMSDNILALKKISRQREKICLPLWIPLIMSFCLLF